MALLGFLLAVAGFIGPARVNRVATQAPVPVWPSGGGEEIGALDLPMYKLARRLGRPVLIDRGAEYLVLNASADLPVILSREPEIEGGAVSVVADKTADRSAVRRLVEGLLGPGLVRWHPERAAGRLA